MPNIYALVQYGMKWREAKFSLPPKKTVFKRDPAICLGRDRVSSVEVAVIGVKSLPSHFW